MKFTYGENHHDEAASPFQQVMMEQPGAYEKLHHRGVEVVHRPEMDTYQEPRVGHSETSHEPDPLLYRQVANKAIDLSLEYSQ